MTSIDPYEKRVFVKKPIVEVSSFPLLTGHKLEHFSPGFEKVTVVRVYFFFVLMFPSAAWGQEEEEDSRAKRGKKVEKRKGKVDGRALGCPWLNFRHVESSRKEWHTIRYPAGQNRCRMRQCDARNRSGRVQIGGMCFIQSEPNRFDKRVGGRRMEGVVTWDKSKVWPKRAPAITYFEEYSVTAYNKRTRAGDTWTDFGTSNSYMIRRKKIWTAAVSAAVTAERRGGVCGGEVADDAAGWRFRSGRPASGLMGATEKQLPSFAGFCLQMECCWCFFCWRY